MTEHCFTELGYFAERDCKAIKERLQGESFYHYSIGWCNNAGNCTLVVRTDRQNTTEDELARHFLWMALSEIFVLSRELKDGRTKHD